MNRFTQWATSAYFNQLEEDERDYLRQSLILLDEFILAFPEKSNICDELIPLLEEHGIEWSAFIIETEVEKVIQVLLEDQENIEKLNQLQNHYQFRICCGEIARKESIPPSIAIYHNAIRRLQDRLNIPTGQRISQ